MWLESLEGNAICAQKLVATSVLLFIVVDSEIAVDKLDNLPD